jgi:hypothetical protein
VSLTSSESPEARVIAHQATRGARAVPRCGSGCASRRPEVRGSRGRVVLAALDSRPSVKCGWSGASVGSLRLDSRLRHRSSKCMLARRAGRVTSCSWPGTKSIWPRRFKGRAANHAARGDAPLPNRNLGAFRRYRPRRGEPLVIGSNSWPLGPLPMAPGPPGAV